MSIGHNTGIRHRLKWRVVYFNGLKALALLASLTTFGWLGLPKPPLLDGVEFSRQVFDRHNKLLRVTLTQDEKYRLFTPLAQISPELIKATLIQEDRYYRRHPGVNPVALSRAAWNYLRSGNPRVGASTITMQLARLRFHIHSRSATGKLQQVFRALEIERHYTKEQILEAYLNLAPYGGNLEGIGAASALCLGKSPAELSLPESVALSAIPQSPTKRTLRRDMDNPALTAAQNRLLERMSADLRGKTFRACALTGPPFQAPHFSCQVLRDHPGQSQLYTTLDLTLQRILEKRIKSFIANNGSRGISNACAMLIDAKSMETLAQVGSADFFDPRIRGQIDGTRSKRSPGSTLKPFVYALALDQGLIHPLSILVDAPQSFGSYNPENFDREFVGPIRAQDALVRSRNIPAIALSARLSRPTLYELLKSAKVDLPQPEEYYGLTLPIGGAEVTLQDLIRLYAALLNGGQLRPIVSTLPDHSEPTLRIFSPESAFLTLEMLGSNARTTMGAENPDQPVFWKTGTSNGFHDAWSVAVFGQYVLAVWVGNFDGSSNPAFSGRTCAGPLLFQIIDALQATGRVHWTPHLPPPGSNLRKVEFCAISGQLPTACCKEQVSGWFIPGISPITSCSVHREVLLDAATGLRVASDDGTRPLKREVFEFWPSNLLELFAQAGLPRRQPPAFLSGCEIEQIANSTGKGLRIVSPKPEVVYATRTGDDESRKLSLKAETDSDVGVVYWFAGKQFLGISRKDSFLTWKPRIGKQIISALDDHGQSASVTLTVLSAQE